MQARSKQGLKMLRQARSEYCGEPTMSPQMERRQWARSSEGYEQAMTRSRFNVALAEEYALFDYVDSAPRGQSYGVRTHKVPLPIDTELNRQRAIDDANTWVGVPVKVVEVPTVKLRVGPGPRSTEMRPTAKLVAAAAAKVSTQRFLADLDSQQQQGGIDIETEEENPSSSKAKPSSTSEGGAAKAVKKQADLERLAALASSSGSSSSQGTSRVETKYSWLPATLVRDAIVDVESTEGLPSSTRNLKNANSSSSSNSSTSSSQEEQMGASLRRSNNPYLRR